MTKLHISFILDETGSMMSVKPQTISGFNEYIDKLKKDKNSSTALFTLTKFNSTKVEIVYDDVILDMVAPLTDRTYQPDELTPLYDAIGKTINALAKKLEGKKKQHALVIIQTDGQENASREYNQKMIFELIGKKKELGWAFAFLGADQDAYIASELINISRGNTMSYKGADTQDAIGVVVAGMTSSYSASNGQSTTGLFQPEEEEK